MYFTNRVVYHLDDHAKPGSGSPTFTAVMGYVDMVIPELGDLHPRRGYVQTPPSFDVQTLPLGSLVCVEGLPGNLVFEVTAVFPRGYQLNLKVAL